MTVGKLQAAELVSEGRIDELEKAIKNAVNEDVGKKMTDMTKGEGLPRTRYIRGRQRKGEREIKKGVFHKRVTF